MFQIADKWVRIVEQTAGTVEKAVDLLFRLHASPESVGVTALSRDVGMPKSSVHRLLASLARKGMVERDERGRYRPGVGLEIGRAHV